MDGEIQDEPVDHVEVTEDRRVTVVHTGPPMIGYRVQWGLSIVLLVFAAMFNAILVMQPADLGIPVVAFRWLTIVNVGLVTLQGLLPRMINPPDPTRKGLD